MKRNLGCGTLRGKAGSELLLTQPLLGGFQIVSSEFMAAIVPVKRNLCAPSLEDLREPEHIIARNDRIARAGRQECRYLARVAHEIRSEWNHRPEKDCTR
jgi:hypothetical protein